MIQIIRCNTGFYPAPKFSWILEGDEDQVSYEITVYNHKKEPIYTTGVVNSPFRHNISCDMSFENEHVYQWSVSVTGSGGGTAIKFAEVFFTPIDNWLASWMEPDRKRKPLTDNTNPVEPKAKGAPITDSLNKLDPVIYWRKEFTLEKIPELALAYASARGIYAMYINGVLVSDLYAPGNTSYDKHIDYQCCDITEHLVTGENVLAFMLADGWYTGKIGAVGIGQQFGTENALIAQLSLTDEEGNKIYIITDEEMKFSEGALRYSDLYIGEYFSEAEEKSGWNQIGYSEGDKWKCGLKKEYGYQELTLQSIPGIRKLRRITPKILIAPNGDMLLDAGENIVGYVSAVLETEAGSRISFEHSETVDKDGNYLQNIIGQNKDQTDFFEFSTSGIKELSPTLTFHGFRYVRVKGTIDQDPAHYTIHVIGTPLWETGKFSCSDERLNILQENIKRSQEGNMISIPTDCPQRERTGWLGDMQVYAPTGCFEYDIESFLRHWMIDIRNDQLPNGEVPHIVPYMASHDIMKPPGIEGVSAAGWSDAAVILPWRLYEAYGDIEILKENFSLMKSYMDSTEIRVAEHPDNYDEMSKVEQERQKYLWNTGFQYGDWLMPSIQMSGRSIFEVVKETGHIVATIMYAMTTRMMADICDVLGEIKLKEHYSEINKKVKQAFAEEYINEDGTLKKDYQGVYVLALQTEVIPIQLREKAVDRLVELIHQNNDLLDTGFLSVAYLLPVLKKYGQKDLANTLMFRDECPSWLYEVKMGATTMWEYWNGYSEDRTPSDCSMNHFAFGCVGEYLFRDILGIQSKEAGYRKVRIQPDMECGLNYAEGAYESVWGKYKISWNHTEQGTEIKVQIPPNTEAEVILEGRSRIVGCGTYTFTI